MCEINSLLIDLTFLIFSNIQLQIAEKLYVLRQHIRFYLKNTLKTLVYSGLIIFYTAILELVVFFVIQP